MRTNVPHIFAIGDIIGQPMLAHKTVHEGKVAVEVAAGRNGFLDEAKAEGIKYGNSLFPCTASDRSLSLGRDEGLTKVLFDEASERIIGCGIVGPNAGDLLAIEMGADTADIRLTIHPHPTLAETIGMATEMFEGSITDLVPPKRRH
jgi:dihydrolipoamide dehydrogenase